MCIHVSPHCTLNNQWVDRILPSWGVSGLYSDSFQSSRCLSYCCTWNWEDQLHMPIALLSVFAYLNFYRCPLHVCLSPLFWQIKINAFMLLFEVFNCEWLCNLLSSATEHSCSIFFNRKLSVQHTSGPWVFLPLSVELTKPPPNLPNSKHLVVNPGRNNNTGHMDNEHMIHCIFSAFLRVMSVTIFLVP